MTKTDLEMNARLFHIDALMGREKQRISVAFKRFPQGDIIALWDDGESRSREGMLSSYQNIGQHSEASADLMEELDDATPDEYLALKIELENIGYQVDVIN